MADASKVVATRNMNVFTLDYDADNDLPADDVDFGGDWTTTDAWVGPYYTDGGLTVDLSVDRAEVTVDQEIWPVLRPITGGSVTFGTDLAEHDMDAIAQATGVGSVSTTAAGAGTRGTEDYEITSTFSESFISMGFEAEQQNGEAIRGIVYKGIASGSPSLQYGVADTKAMTRLEVQAIPGASGTTHPVLLLRRYLPAE